MKVNQVITKKTPPEQAESLLELAATYAGDGSFHSAVELALEAIAVMKGEKPNARTSHK